MQQARALASTLSSWSRRWALVLVGLGLLLPGLASTAPEETPLRLCGTDASTVAPAVWQAANLQPGATGPSRDAFLAALLTQLTGLPTTVVYMSNGRCISETAANRLDGVLALSALPQRMAMLHFPLRDGLPDRDRRLNTFSYHWYVRRDGAWQYAPPKRLTGPQTPVVGVVAGYSVASLLEADGYRTEPVYGGTLAVMRMVAARRLDVGMLLDYEVQPILQKYAELGRQLAQLTPAYAVRDYYMVFSPQLLAQRPDIAHRLWSAMPQLREITERIHLDQP